MAGGGGMTARNALPPSAAPAVPHPHPPPPVVAPPPPLRGCTVLVHRSVAMSPAQCAAAGDHLRAGSHWSQIAAAWPQGGGRWRREQRSPAPSAGPLLGGAGPRDDTDGDGAAWAGPAPTHVVAHDDCPVAVVRADLSERGRRRCAGAARDDARHRIDVSDAGCGEAALRAQLRRVLGRTDFPDAQDGFAAWLATVRVSFSVTVSRDVTTRPHRDGRNGAADVLCTAIGDFDGGGGALVLRLPGAGAMVPHPEGGEVPEVDG
eukprot:gene15302-41318_t